MSAVDQLVVVLLAWISTHTGLVAPPPLAVHFAPHRELSRKFYGDADWPARPLQGVYERSNRTIYLRAEAEKGDLRAVSVLLHELTHHVQRSNRLSLPCPQAYERQAFELQLLWLRQQGTDDPYRVVGASELTILQLTACPDLDTVM
jgi:hypothetical protein